jgi:hypothetical protein
MEAKEGIDCTDYSTLKIDREYVELVNLVSQKELDFDVSNSSMEHAKYLVSKIYEKTKKA